MGSLGRYIFRATMVAFLITLVTLTVVIWFTQAMRDFDLITSERQTLFVFVGITGMIVPLLVMIIAPIALMISAAHVLNRLGSDSEIIVMNAAGVSPWRLLWPFVIVAFLVSLLVATIAAYVSPRALRELRDWSEQVRADILTNIVQPGRFTSVNGNLTFHIADRRPNGLLVGIFVDDRRDPNEQSTILADQGEIVQNDRGTYLFLQNGSVQRHKSDERDPTIVRFERYAFDLSRLVGAPQPINEYLVREHYTWELLRPRPYDAALLKQPRQFRAELHDRLVAPLYPLVFVIIAFAYLGAPRTTRQSRTMSMVSAVSGVAALRVIGFVSLVLGINRPYALTFQYIGIAVATGLGLFAIAHGTIIEPPAFVVRAVTAVTERLSRRFATT